VKPLAVHVRTPKRKKRPELAPAPVQPLLAPARIRHAHPELGLLVAVAPAAAISLPAPSVTRSHSAAPLLLVLLAVGMLLLAAAVTPAWRVERVHLSPLARTLNRHQLDLALAGGSVLFATLALYIVATMQH
jgi:hypothetical protein